VPFNFSGEVSLIHGSFGGTSFERSFVMDEKSVECRIREDINARCTCPKTDCPRHGLCCLCITAHKNRADDPIVKRFPHCLRDLVKEGMGGS
jgi:hypothetical protein